MPRFMDEPTAPVVVNINGPGLETLVDTITVQQGRSREPAQSETRMTCLLSENFYNLRQFPNHTLSTKEGGSTPTPANGQSGYEVHRVANARRHSRDYYTPTAANSNADLDVTCDRVRAADMLVLDRNSNLAGETVRLWASSESDFGTYEEFTFTVPKEDIHGQLRKRRPPSKDRRGRNHLQVCANVCEVLAVASRRDGC